jgi:poly(3-hydroxybutyrate) depolymerase
LDLFYFYLNQKHKTMNCQLTKQRTANIVLGKLKKPFNKNKKMDTFIKRRLFIALFMALFSSPTIVFSQVLTNNTSISITKTWSLQPSGYTYPINISVPTGPVPIGGFPVCILLHGNGSANLSNLAGPPMLSQQQFGSVLPCHILVAPTGYQNSWNICAENSDAPDLEMINDLINILQGYTNVNPYKFRVLGTSNGAGLANRVFIENTNDSIDIICAVVSHLNDFQYHLGNFYKPSGITNPSSSYCGYDVVSNPLSSRKYLSISNINDQLIPYNGGLSLVGATFLPAETAAFTIATYKGYTGSLLTTGTTAGSGSLVITAYSYLSGDVVHVKGTAQHSINATQKAFISDYFSDCDAVLGIEDYDLSKIEIYPNPASNVLNIKVDAVLIGKIFSIYDNLGRNILVGKLNSEISNINIAELTKGVYFLIIEGELNHVVKVVKE